MSKQDKSEQEAPTDLAKQSSLDHDLEQLRLRQPAAPSYLQGRILANLPERDAGQEFFDWLRASAWRGVTAAVLPIVLGFAIGIGAGDEPDLDLATDSLIFADVWEAYESDEI